MARPERNDVDYFPHPVSHGKKMFYLRSKYGNDGYAVWFMLLEELGKAEYHYLNLEDDMQLMYLTAEFKVSETVLKDIIGDLVRMEEFDKELWEKECILYNKTFVESVADAYKKRNNQCVDKNALLVILDSKGLLKQIKSNPLHDNYRLNGGEKPQRKEKDRIEKESKERDHVFENSILNFFGFGETNFNHVRTVSAFIHSITEKGQLEYFKEQFKSYCEYKNREGFKHAMKNYLGDQKEQFANGLWDSENWTEKVKSLTQTEPKAAAVQQSKGFILGQKPMGAVRHG